MIIKCLSNSSSHTASYGQTFVCFYPGKYTPRRKKDYHINDLEINIFLKCVNSLHMKQEITAEEFFKDADSQTLSRAQRREDSILQLFTGSMKP